MPETLTSQVPHFCDLAELRDALDDKNNFNPVDLYPRDGTKKLSELEGRIAELVGVEADELVLCNSGMAAVIGAIEANLTKGGTIVCAEQTYAQTSRYLSDQRSRHGLKVVNVDSGNLEAIDRAIQTHRPSVFLSETVGNGPDVPVLDTLGLLALDSVADVDPVIILDNTLPLATGLPLGGALTPERKVIGVESGTKSYSFNRELSGLIYTKHPELLQQIKQQRRTKGFVPNLSAIGQIDQLLPTPADFTERNRTIFANTTELAKACYEVAHDAKVHVSHPLLDNHPNYPLAEIQFCKGLTPVFFLQCLGSFEQFELTERLWGHPVVRDQAVLGQSFGFDETRIWPDGSYPAVRIAGGARTDAAKLGAALKEALVS